MRLTDRARPAGLLCGLVIAVALVAPAPTRAQTDWISLWNGKDLTGWTTWLARPEPSVNLPGARKDANGRYLDPIGLRDPLNVFTVVPNVDGRPAMRISGEVYGEIRTTQWFRDYHLRFAFKWGEKKWPPRAGVDIQRDSGLLYHVHSEPGAEGRTWARSIELQIQERDVGDLYAVGSAIAVRVRPRAGATPVIWDYDPTGEWTFFSQRAGSSGRVIKQPDNERPSGEWNIVELIAFGDDAIHIVNGRVVMRLHSPMRIDRGVPMPVTSGPIILQSEGAEVFYRDIVYRPITAIPAEFAGP